MTLRAIAHLAVVLGNLWRPAEEARPLRIIDTATLHVGIRPAIVNGGMGVTFQVSW